MRFRKVTDVVLSRVNDPMVGWWSSSTSHASGSLIALAGAMHADSDRSSVANLKAKVAPKVFVRPVVRNATGVLREIEVGAEFTGCSLDEGDSSFVVQLTPVGHGEGVVEYGLNTVWTVLPVSETGVVTLDFKDLHDGKNEIGKSAIYISKGRRQCVCCWSYFRISV